MSQLSHSGRRDSPDTVRLDTCSPNRSEFFAEFQPGLPAQICKAPPMQCCTEQNQQLRITDKDIVGLKCQVKKTGM